MKKILAVLLVLTVLTASSGCSIVSRVFGTGVQTDANGAVHAVDGYAEGRIGDTMWTAFFEFTVQSAEYVDSYAGYEPQEGCRLIDTVIRVRNTFGEELPMYSSDFQIQWGSDVSDVDDDAFDYPIEPLDDTMAPEEYKLPRGGSAEYHHVFEVPQGESDYSISYLEYFEDDTEGDVFFIYFEL